MKKVMFKKLKGKVNTNPHNFALIVKRDSDIQIDNNAVVVKCDTLREHRIFARFLRQYIFNALDEDESKHEIYMPKSYILRIDSVPDDYLK